MPDRRMSRAKLCRRFERLNSLFAVVMLVVPALIGPRALFASPAMPLHTSGRFIVDSNGQRVHLNAVNWYGAESSDYVVAGLQAQPLASIANEIKSLGFNAVRLPWSNQMVESNPVIGNSALTANINLQGEKALTVFDAVVSTLTSNGIMVILDNHNSNAEWCCDTKDGNSLWYNTNYPEANWISDWQMMVQRYKGNPLVIGVDLRNEPRNPATWGGSASTDWHAAAQRGGNAVLAINPSLLVFVEGVDYAGDLSGVTNLPIQLSIANQLIYEAHDYGFWHSNGFASYSDYLNTINPRWGYLVTGTNPQPLWIGEFGTCNSSSITCVASSIASDNGYWFQAMTSLVEQYGIDWSYWAVNGTSDTDHGGIGSVEGYGVLNTAWNGSALTALTSRLQNMMAPGASFNLVANSGTINIAPSGATANTAVTIVPAGGFSGSVNLSCSISGSGNAANLPRCSVPSTETITGNAAVSAVVSVTTMTAVAKDVHRGNSGLRKIKDGGSGLVLAATLVLLGDMRRWRKTSMFVMLLLISSCAIAACGNGSGSAVATSGSYIVTVTATSSSANSVSAQIALNVQ